MTAEELLNLYEAQTRKVPVDTTKKSNGYQVYNWRMECIRDLRKLLAQAKGEA